MQDLLLPALALVFTIAFVTLWQADPARRHLLGFAVGFFALGLAMSLHMVFPALDTAEITPILHGMACISVIAIVWGCAARLNQKIPLTAMLAVTAVSGAILYPALASGNGTVALVVQNGASGILFGIGAIVLWIARPMDILDRVLVWTMVSIAAFGTVRPAVLMLINADIQAVVERKTAINTASLMFITALAVVLGVSLVAIAIRDAIEIRYRAKRADPVSGFLEQQTFDHAAEEAMSNAHRLGLPASLAVFEIDRFDAFREEWGEETSNLVLRDLADTLRACQRDGDIVGRIGENQFGVLLVGMNAGSGLKLAKNVRDEVERKSYESVGGMMNATLSCGIVEGNLHDSYQYIARQALSSLRDPKSVGSNRIFVNGREHEADRIGRSDTDSIIALG